MTGLLLPTCNVSIFNTRISILKSSFQYRHLFLWLCRWVKSSHVINSSLVTQGKNRYYMLLWQTKDSCSRWPDLRFLSCSVSLSLLVFPVLLRCIFIECEIRHQWSQIPLALLKSSRVPCLSTMTLWLEFVCDTTSCYQSDFEQTGHLTKIQVPWAVSKVILPIHWVMRHNCSDICKYLGKLAAMMVLEVHHEAGCFLGSHVTSTNLPP